MVVLPHITYVVTFIVGFGFGAIFGWYASLDSVSLSERGFRRIVAFVIMTVWVHAVIADIMIGTYDVPVLVHGIMGAVAGYLFSDDGLGDLSINLGGK